MIFKLLSNLETGVKKSACYREEFYSRSNIAKWTSVIVRPVIRITARGVPLIMLWFLSFFAMPTAFAQFSSGDGTPGNPYIIINHTQLAQLATYVNEGAVPYSNAGIYYKLGDNIDLSNYHADEGWISIGNTTTRPFRGIFDGDGKIVTGLKVNNYTTRTTAGLFGVMAANSVVRNVGVVNADIVTTTSNSAYTGGIVGYNQGTVENCFFIGSITSANNTNYTAGIAGLNWSATSKVENCYSMGYVTVLRGNNAYAGGVVGDNNNGVVLNCYSTVSVVSASNTAFAGGIVGRTDGATSNVSNNAALNPSLNCTGGTRWIGRVAGNNLAGLITNNIAFNSMYGFLPKNTYAFPEAIIFENIGTNLKDGADITLGTIISDGTIGGKFTTAVWTIENGKLPGFGEAVNFPGFLNGNPFAVVVNITPSLVGMAKGNSQTFDTEVLGFNFTGGTIPVTWNVNSETSGTTISNDGVLTVAAAETAETLTVTATVSLDNTLTGSATVYFNENFTGKGSETEPYLISTPAELANFAQLVNNNNVFYTASNYKLNANIDLSEYGENFNNGAGWIPIGWFATAASFQGFKGVFDGNGHTITGLYINNSTLNCSGLFGYLEYGTIKNLKITDSEVNTTNTSSSAVFYTGGVVGYNLSGKVENCMFSGLVSSTLGTTNIYVGGIVGDNNKANGVSNPPLVINCYSMGSVAANLNLAGSPNTFAGGIAGRNNNGIISNCWSTAMIYSISNITTDPASAISNSYSGGIAGQNNGFGASLSNCLALNPSINCTSSGLGSLNRNTGRITGSNISGTLIDNIAFSNIINLPDGDSFNNIGASNLDGANITVTEINADGTFAGKFTTPVWATQNGKLPGFGAPVDMPDHLSGDPVIISIKIEPEEVVLKKGDIFTLNATVFGHNINGNLIWSIDGASNGTTISNTGVLTIDDNESEVKFTVTTTSAEDNSKSFTVQVYLLSGGSGTAENPYIITTADQLALLSEKVNEFNLTFYDKHSLLGNDLDLSAYGENFNNGEGWIPIGNFPNQFKGVFDGDNYKITGFYLNNLVGNFVGLFGRAATGTVIKNLGIEDIELISVNNVNSQVGGILGGASSSSIEISNCWVTGSIKATTTGGYPSVGGIIGSISGVSGNSAVITRCWFTGTIEGQNNNSSPYAGGIAGQITANVTISHCYTMGSVSSFTNSTTTSGCYSGGIAGQNNGANSIIQNCWSTAMITSLGNATAYAGGITGNMANATARVENCVALNPAINYQASNNIYFGRVIGRYQTGVRNNNLGLNNMLNLNDGISTWSNIGANEIDGADITATTLIADGTIGGRFTEVNKWDVEDGKLPGFRSPIDLPDYLSGIPTVILLSVIPDGVIVRQGESQNFEALVLGYNLETEGITWSIEGGVPGSTITQEGLLTVADDETAEEIIVRATSTEDITKSGTATVIVSSLFEGNGTEENPYIIATAEDLALLAQLVNAGNYIFNDKYYKVVNDIDFNDLDEDFNNGNGWIPIGISAVNSFRGVLDGDNYTLTGLFINNTTLLFKGLFGYIESGTVKNINIENLEIISNVPTSYNYSGCVAGYCSNTDIINVSASGLIAANDNSSYIGGIAGNITNLSLISHCSFIGEIISTCLYIGGITGNSQNTSIVTNCFVEGVIDVTNAIQIGGVVGYNTNFLRNSYFSGSITVTCDGFIRAGGVVGYNYYGSVTNCYSMGSVKSINSISGPTSTGGLAAYNSGIISNCWTTSAVIQEGFSQNEGGIVSLGTNSAILQNSVALNHSLYRNPPGMTFGRVLGHAAVGGTTVINCYGFSHMINPSGGTTWFNIPPNSNQFYSTDGFDITLEEIHNDCTFGGLFIEENGWTIENGKLPGLFGSAIEMPDHLKLGDAYSLSGKVTSDDAPEGLEGVTVTLRGIKNYTAVTDELGDYLIEGVYEGFPYTITASKTGYTVHTGTVEIDGEDLIYNANIMAINVHTVSGMVFGNDKEGGIEGVEITLSGYADFTTTSNAVGEYSIPGVYEGFIYTLKASKIEYKTYTGSVSVSNSNVTYSDITLIERISPVSNITAIEDGDDANITWNVPSPPQPDNYLLDDGSAEEGISINPNAQNWLGNQFIVNEEGELTSVDIFARHSPDNSNRQLIVDIFNAQRELIGSSEPFLLASNAWVNVPLNSISYSGMFYVMVQWPATGGNTHYMGYDLNGPYANAGLNWVKWGDNWGVLHEVADAPAGVFMIRSNVNTYEGFVSYGAPITKNESENKINLIELDILKSNVPIIAPDIESPKNQLFSDSVTQLFRTLQTYEIYRLLDGQPENEWVLVSDNVTDTEYIDTGWAELGPGGYMYAVKAVYTTGTSSARLSNGLGKDWSVDYQIFISTNSGDPATGANVILKNQNGLPEFTYETTSGVDGVIFEGMWKGIYDLEITLDGFMKYTVNDLTILEDGLSHSATLLIILFPVGSISAKEVGNNVLVEWTQPNTPIIFRYDNGNATGQAGFNISSTPPFFFPNGVIGSCHNVNATITSMSWFLTSAVNAAPTQVNLWVFALNAQGLPTTNLLFSETGVVSTKLEWNTFVFPQPIEAPNGFYIALSHSTNYLSLGTTTPDNDYPYIPNTQFASQDYTQLPFSHYQDIIFMVRAEGIVMGRGVIFGYTGENPNKNTLPLYNVYRLTAGQPEDEWETLASNTQNLSYTDETWDLIEWGEIQYAVRAVYTNNLLSAAALSRPLVKNMYVNYQINISTNSGVSATGAAVSLKNRNKPELTYELTSSATGILAQNIWRGSYDLVISLTGHENYSAILDITEVGGSHSATLTEIIYPVSYVTAEIVDNNAVIAWQGGLPFINEWIRWSINDLIALRIGFREDQGADMTAAIRFTSGDLASYGIVSGHTITKIALGIGTHMAQVNTMELRIWEGGSSVASPGQLVYTQPITDYNSFTEMGIKEVELNTPFIIDATKELRIGWRIVNTAGYPFGCDAGPAVAGKGDIFYLNGAWLILSDAISNFDNNFSIKAFVTDGGGNQLDIRNYEYLAEPSDKVERGIRNEKESEKQNSNYFQVPKVDCGMQKLNLNLVPDSDSVSPLFSDSDIPIFSYSINRLPLGYNLYRLLEGQTEEEWDTVVENVNGLGYTDTNWANLAEGSYQYAVRTVFGSGLTEAILSNPIIKKPAVYYSVTVVSTGNGTVEILGYQGTTAEFAEGTSVTVKATADTEWAFEKWTDEDEVVVSSLPVYSFTVSEDIVLTAHFTEVGIRDNILSNIVLYPNPFKNEINISNPAVVKSVQIFDAMGIKRYFDYAQLPKAESKTSSSLSYQKQNGDIVIDTSLLLNGVYFVEIESVAGDKVVYKMVKK